MSRVAKMPVDLPQGVTATISADAVTVKGAKGSLTLPLKSGVKVEDIEDIILGCAFPEGEQGLNVARLIGLLADLPIKIGGMTVNRFCGSSMSAILGRLRGTAPRSISSRRHPRYSTGLRGMTSRPSIIFSVSGRP